MDQISRRKKKGRPSKADLAARLAVASTPDPPEKWGVRRSLRRRSFRYNIIDYDEDYLDDEFVVEEDDGDEHKDERRREKKLKLVLQLPNGRPSRDGGDLLNQTLRANRRTAVSEEENEKSGKENDDDDDEEGQNRVAKKRKFSGGDCDDDNDEERWRRGEFKRGVSVSGPLVDTQYGTPLPGKKQLELILDKLQKRDTYGVYAEPIDPEELPDYHDIIEHPMDFATVRKKLANGSYTNLKQFESDVFLICSNAMLYNAPETIFYKQARAIKELAEKKFQQIRNEIEKSEKEQKSEPKTCPNSVVKEQRKKPICGSMLESAGSDFSSGATLASVDAQNTNNVLQAGNCERLSNNDGMVEGISFFTDSNEEKAENLQPGKCVLTEFWKKSFVADENRRATYDTSNPPVDRSSELIFTTFEGEKKQLVSVGLQGEHSYARSLARFAAAVGPVAWRIASKKIQQALPPGFKFGHGWVGEYDPLPTPIIFLKSRDQSEDPFSRNLHCLAAPKIDTFPKTSVPLSDHLLSVNAPGSNGKHAFIDSGQSTPPTTKTAINQERDQLSSNKLVPENVVVKREESNCLDTVNQSIDHDGQKLLQCVAKMPNSRPLETITREINLLPAFPFKQSDSNGVVPRQLTNGKIINSSVNVNHMIGSPKSIPPARVVGATTSFPQIPEQCLTDPVQITSTVPTQKQQNRSNPPLVSPQVTPSVLLLRADNRSNAAAAAAAASVWMSVGFGGFKPTSENPITNRTQISADLLYNATRDADSRALQSHDDIPVSETLRFDSRKKGVPFQAFVPQPVKVFPQFASTDLSRFHGQSSWRGLSPYPQQRQAQDKLPLDLNIAFQSSIDCQQPDLALQL
ncbi:hypothetical protein Nepgr_007594 [Nepenthes gracilis]|uniref:Bromo domain-containing protein n=1 Tax=Nepenthes gracilis TaxID=150966 RepID=A0AAD3S7J4_NEPGR|nr:hypothetical protein Nepgr_007594 [Nepenthes gracilis]